MCCIVRKYTATISVCIYVKLPSQITNVNQMKIVL